MEGVPLPLPPLFPSHLFAVGCRLAHAAPLGLLSSQYMGHSKMQVTAETHACSTQCRAVYPWHIPLLKPDHSVPSSEAFCGPNGQSSSFPPMSGALGNSSRSVPGALSSQDPFHPCNWGVPAPSCPTPGPSRSKACLLLQLGVRTSSWTSFGFRFQGTQQRIADTHGDSGDY
jgi:hypothetical protein